jgi:hypothetical protein
MMLKNGGIKHLCDSCLKASPDAIKVPLCEGEEKQVERSEIGWEVVMCSAYEPERTVPMNFGDVITRTTRKM